MPKCSKENVNQNLNPRGLQGGWVGGGRGGLVGLVKLKKALWVGYTCRHFLEQHSRSPQVNRYLNLETYFGAVHFR